MRGSDFVEFGHWMLSNCENAYGTAERARTPTELFVISWVLSIFLLCSVVHAHGYVTMIPDKKSELAHTRLSDLLLAFIPL